MSNSIQHERHTDPPSRRRRRFAAAATATSLIAGSVLVGAVSSPSQILALPGPEESTVVTVGPTRVLDSRVGAEVGLAGRFQSRVSRKLQITGTIATYDETTDTRTNKIVVPAGATGVLLNVTGVGPSANGHISIRPGDATGLAPTSSLNLLAGQVVANAVTVAVPTAGANAGQIDIQYFAAPNNLMDIVIDVVGYTTSAGLADIATQFALKANVADVYTKAQVDAAILARSPIAQSTASTNATAGPAPTGAIGLTVTVQAPVAGTILANGSASILGPAIGTYECRLTMGAGVTNNVAADQLDDTDRRVEFGAVNLDGHCATNGAVTVGPGSHVINLVLENADATDDFDDATLDALFVPGGVFTASRSPEGASREGS